MDISRLKTALFCCLLMVAFSNIYGQINLTPDGALDNVFDRYGNQYQLADLIVPSQGGNSLQPSLVACSTTTYFNLFFEPGCGMESPNDPIEIARRAVVCKVFEDLSNFIVSPLTANGNKVNIWVRNIDNVPNINPNSYLGLASGFYQLPNNANQGGIADNEIWKTIHTGVDSYINTTVPLGVLGAGNNQAGLFYHGMVAFNFNDVPGYNWNVDLEATSIPTDYFDLYSAVLHEVTHALGFASLIDSDGTSNFPANYNYYNRYDTFLRTNDGSAALLLNDGNSELYNYAFNNSLSTDVLHPNISNCIPDFTNCNSAIKFYTSDVNSVPVYTPNCFDAQSSLSHFEDSLFPDCILPNGDDDYFLMCNAGNSGMIRRFLKPEERDALCRIGYTVNSTYGSAAVFGSFYDYGGTACAGISVAGVNDGIEDNGTYTYVTAENVPVLISGDLLLSNDANTTGFQDLDDLTEFPGLPTTLSGTSGTALTNIWFSSGVSGVHVLRYVPTNGTQAGNITYVFVYVEPNTDGIACNPVQNVCDFVGNGDFEENNDYLTQPNNNQFVRACGWYGAGNNWPHYFLANGVAPGSNVPCNTYGFEPDAISGNQGYAGILTRQFANGDVSTQIIGTTFATPLMPGTTYELSFDVSLADFVNHRFAQLRAFISSSGPASIPGSVIQPAVMATGMLLSDPTFVDTTQGWQKLTFTFTTDENATDLNHLYIGALNNPPMEQGDDPLTVAGCVDNFTLSPPTGAFYYIDNVSLKPLLEITGPNTVCIGDDPVTYTSNQPGSVWSSSDTSVAGVDPDTGELQPYQAGNFTLTNTFENGSCSYSTSLEVIVFDSQIQPVFSFPTVICVNSTPPVLPTLSDNGIPGAWSPPIVSNTQTANYSFLPSNDCSPIFKQTIQVIPDGSLVANIDEIYVPFGGGSNLNIMTNDIYNGMLPATAVGGLLITIVSTTNASIIVNQDGTLSLPADLPIGTYIVKYYLKNTCLLSNDTQIIIHIINATIEAGRREYMDGCYNPNSYTTTQSVLDRVRIGGVQATASLVQFANIVAPAGFVVNPNGTIVVPAGTLPGTYSISYSICPFGSNSGCVTGITCQVTVHSTVRANPDIFYFMTDGTFLSSNHNDPNDFNIITDDGYSSNCGLLAPNSFVQAVLGNNVSNLVITDQSELSGNFIISGTTGSVLAASQNIAVGSYNFTYSICDAAYPNVICSETNGIIAVTGYARMTAPNSQKIKRDFNEIKITPNPSDGLISVSFQNIIVMGKIKIFSLLGQELLSEPISQSKEKLIDLSSFSGGTYMLSIEESGNITSRLIFKK